MKLINVRFFMEINIFIVLMEFPFLEMIITFFINFISATLFIAFHTFAQFYYCLFQVNTLPIVTFIARCPVRGIRNTQGGT